MSEVKERLQAAGAQCLTAYEAWSGNQKDDKARQSLQESIHELRKVMSRLEIDLAISERDQMGHRQLPIPPHRASRKKHQGDDSFADSDEDNFGNTDQGSSSSSGHSEGRKTMKIQRRKPMQRKSGGE